MVEPLEARVLFSGSYLWTGAADDGGKWSNPLNWAGLSAPSGSDNTLTFTDAAVDKTSVNDLRGLGVANVRFDGSGYTLGGNGLTLTGGVSSRGNDFLPSTNALAMPLTVPGDATISAEGAATIDLGGRASVRGQLAFAGRVWATVAGKIDGRGSLLVDTTGTVTLQGANTYAGATTVRAGNLVAAHYTALGSTKVGTTVHGGFGVRGTVGPEPVTLGGFLLTSMADGAFLGPVTLDAPSSVRNDAPLRLDGPLDTRGFDLAVAGFHDLTVASVAGGGRLTLDVMASSAQRLILPNANPAFTGDTAVAGGTLVVGSGGSLGSGALTIAGGALEAAQVVSLPNPVTFDNRNGFSNEPVLRGAAATFTGPASFRASFGSGIATAVFEADVTFAGAADFQDDNRLDVAAGRTATFAGSASGSNSPGVDRQGITKVGDGTLALTGSAPNTYAGELGVDAGLVLLGKTGGPATGGALRLGLPSGGTRPVVRLLAPDQLADAAPVTIEAGATLDLNGHADTVGPLTLMGTLTTGGAVLGLGGDVSVPWGQPALLGDIYLPATRTISGASDLRLDGAVGGPGGLAKDGWGTLFLSGANTYAGATEVRDGGLVVFNSAALGSPAGGTTVLNNGRLVLAAPMSVTAESLSLNGGALLNLSGDSAWTGSVSLAGFSNVFVSAGSLEITGAVGGTGGLSTGGDGTLTLSAGDNSYDGLVQAQGKALVVNGSLADADVTVLSGATLAGVGAVGHLTAPGGVVAPGDPRGGDGIGTLAAASADFTRGGTLLVQVAGDGSVHDRLAIAGVATLDGSSVLSLDLAGVTTGGTAPGVMTYSGLSGAFGTVNNNRRDQHPESLVYGPTALDVLLA